MLKVKDVGSSEIIAYRKEIIVITRLLILCALRMGIAASRLLYRGKDTKIIPIVQECKEKNERERFKPLLVCSLSLRKHLFCFDQSNRQSKTHKNIRVNPLDILILTN